MPLGLSTSWNSFRYANGRDIVEAIKKLGFKNVELNFGLTSDMVKDILDLARLGLIQVLSTHNFCPIPEGVERHKALPDYFSISSQEGDERERAIAQTKKSIDTAETLGAAAVIMHSGRVEIRDSTRELIMLYNARQKGTPDYNTLLNAMAKEREARRKPYLENALRSLGELNRYAESKNVFIGIENRFYYHEIPSFEEIREILDKFENSNIFYWHDTGHAQVLENLGFAKHVDYLKEYSQKMIGIHLHATTGTQDHQPPLEGELDFKMFVPYVRKETLKIIEAHHPTTAEDLIRSKVYLESVFDEKL